MESQTRSSASTNPDLVSTLRARNGRSNDQQRVRNSRNKQTSRHQKPVSGGRNDPDDMSRRDPPAPVVAQQPVGDAGAVGQPDVQATDAALPRPPGVQVPCGIPDAVNPVKPDLRQLDLTALRRVKLFHVSAPTRPPIPQAWPLWLVFLYDSFYHYLTPLRFVFWPVYVALHFLWWLIRDHSAEEEHAPFDIVEVRPIIDGVQEYTTLTGRVVATLTPGKYTSVQDVDVSDKLISVLRSTKPGIRARDSTYPILFALVGQQYDLSDAISYKVAQNTILFHMQECVREENLVRSLGFRNTIPSS